MHKSPCTRNRHSLKEIIWSYVSGEKFLAAGVLAGLAQGWISGILVPLKRKMMMYAVALVLAIASITVIIYGLGSALGSFFPQWVPGTGQVLVGIIFLLVAWAYARSK